MLTDDQAAQNAFNAYRSHVRFWEAREGGAPVSEEQLREGFSRWCARAGERKEESRKKVGRLMALEAEESLPYLPQPPTPAPFAPAHQPQPPPPPISPYPRPTTPPKPPRRVV